MAYGAYRLGSWLWNSYFGDHDDESGYNVQDEHETEEGQLVDEARDVLYEWCSDGDSRKDNKSRQAAFTPLTQRGKDLFQEDEDDDPFAAAESDSGNSSSSNRKGRKKTQSYRSRRSRHDWSEENHHKRSHRPSPSHHYHHRHGRDDREQQFISETEETDEPYTTATAGKEHTANSGLLSNGMSKAASLASAGMTSAMNAAMKSQFGNLALDKNSGDGSNTTISPFLRNSRMARCRVECTRAMLDFLPTLKKAVAKETDASNETGELKKLRAQRREMLGNGESSRGDENEVVIRERERYLW